MANPLELGAECQTVRISTCVRTVARGDALKHLNGDMTRLDEVLRRKERKTLRIVARGRLRSCCDCPLLSV
jgi:hypothetical protein